MRCRVHYLLLPALLIGCDRPPQEVKDEPTTRPAVVVAPVDQPAVDLSGRPTAVLSVAGKVTGFPAGKLAVLKRTTGNIGFRLCSDDPAAAIQHGYLGNSFLLDFRLPIDRLDDLPSTTWESDHDPDAAGGIYLRGYKDRYRPDHVQMTFRRETDGVRVFLNGTFEHESSMPVGQPSVHIDGSILCPWPQ